MDSRLDTLKQSLESAMEGMSSEQLSWHLPGKWSAAEVLEHLYLTYTGTIKGLEKVMTRGAPLATRPSHVATRADFRGHEIRLYTCRDERPPQSSNRKGCPWSRCETTFGQSSRRWMRPSRGVKPASAAMSSCSTIRFWVRLRRPSGERSMWCTDDTIRNSCSGFANARQKLGERRRTTRADHR